MPLVLLLILLVGCERVGDGEDRDRVARLSALDKLHADLATMPRKHSPTEAKLEHTMAYVDLEFAYGYARLGNAAKARALVSSSKAALPSDDVVHAYLVAAYAARVEQAIGREPIEAPLPDEVETRLVTSDRVARYKIDRLREDSTVLSAMERPDAIGAFSSKSLDVRGPAVQVLRAIRNQGTRAAEVARLVDTAATAAPGDAANLLSGCFDAMLDLPASSADELARATKLLDRAPEKQRAVLYAKAIVATVNFERKADAIALIKLLDKPLAVAASDDAAWAIQTVSRISQRIGVHREFLAMLESTTLSGPAGVARGGALGKLDDVDDARSKLSASMTMPARLAAIRVTAAAYARASTSRTIAAIDDLAKYWVDTTDSFGTNSHYCLSVVGLADSLVLGLVGE